MFTRSIASHLTFTALAATLLFAGCGQTDRSSGPGPEDPDAPKEFTTTDTGLKYRILRKGSGDHPGRESFVTVDYVGWLDSGREFDSSYNRREPATFNLSSVIPAWTEGVQLIGEGGMIELEVPSDLGYGAAGMPPTIPPNATLHFKVELYDSRQ
ncbi:FKBP-type peptidyl-prolyl cis-trans isomerase [Rhodopirellula sp. JC740]|uniref:Peptidyl-prolyl cis-trans isomerase n=1 Tax=Rhodopirellula halodulae TaxID=2894198 RepID=A0ABS8NMB6_9BACT|nr:FKBP-type peptidyl-prolyl cis-trans isomerase [Rhodopirellula sp. JC740]MCC9644690.1 FKBP-type peptidyl-prolyl cis-trans isomerase [Rhodopirellula sp. JC740]